MNADTQSVAVAVVVMAKQPRPGESKTRLKPALSAEEAAEFYACMLRDRCEWLRRVEGVTPAIAFAGWRGEGSPPAITPTGFEVVPQPEGDIGVGLGAAAEHFLSRGLPVVLVDSDSPTLPLEHLRRAVALLRSGEAECVIGPAEDGGYCLLGLARPCPALFVDMPWSSDCVARLTLERAAAAGLETRTLHAHWDVDVPEDLERLERTLFSSEWPAHTAEWLRRRRLARMPRDSSARVPEAQRWCAPWQRLSSRAVYETPWLRLREDHVRLPTGGHTTYSVVDTGECVGVLPFTDDGRVLLVRQYRYITGRVSWEMPTGGKEPHETAERAARRELAEEAHVAAAQLERFCSYHTSKSVMDETAHLFLARELSPAEGQPDETEFIRVERVPFARALAMLDAGEITDGMTIIALLHAARVGWAVSE
ncbi:MAG: DUF2064 domain-containing protein [Deltaproteobacteria bacterium]|nr:DUF2064 domain-containing protein [Deltaproteobacteria bacterium]